MNGPTDLDRNPLMDLIKQECENRKWMAGIDDPGLFFVSSIRRELFQVTPLTCQVGFPFKSIASWLIYIKIVMTLVERDEYA